VETGTPSAAANALVPPNLSMIADTVICNTISENRNSMQAAIAKGVIAPWWPLSQSGGVLTTAELLARLTERGIRNSDIARALGVHPSRVTEMFKGARGIKLDEAAKLVSEFALESPPSQRVSPLPAPVAALIVQHVALQLGHPLEEGSSQLQALSEDIRAFAEFVTDPKVRESIDLAMAFFQAMRLRRPLSEEEAKQGTDSLTAK
jgi:hypothetical protein